METMFKILIIVCPLVFTAGFVDAVAGGGGLISLPAYMLAGLPIHIASGSNKFSASLGTVIAAGNYIKSGKVKWDIAVISAIGAIIGSSLGTTLALYIAEGVLKGIMMIVIPIVALFLATQKNLGKDTIPKKWSQKVKGVVTLLIGVAIGCYDGLIGPGTGTFLIIAFSMVLGIDLVTASGCAKITNLASNITSLMIYLMSGKVIFLVAIPATLCSMLGANLGARFAIKGGAKNIRYIMFVVIGLLFIKTIMGLI